MILLVAVIHIIARTVAIIILTCHGVGGDDDRDGDGAKHRWRHHAV